MLEKGKISARQFAMIVAFYIVGSAILIIPSMLAAKAKQDAWIAALLSVSLGMLIIPLYDALGRRFPDMNFAQYCEVILGRWLGKAAFLLFLTYPFIGATLTLRNIGDFMSTQILRETPIQAIHILYIAVVVMGVRLGLEPLARAAELFFPWILMLSIVLIVLVSPQMKAVNMLPVLEGGLMPVVKATIPFLTFPFFGTVVFLMLFPAVNRIEKAGKAMFAGELVGGLLLIVIAILGITVIGPEQLVRSSFPSYEIAQRINIGDFLERIEAILAIIWVLTIFFRLSVLIYALTLGLAQTFNLREHRFLAVPVSFVIVPCSIFFVPSSTYLSNFNQTILPVYLPTFGLILPLLLLVIAVIRKKGAGKANG